MLYRKNESRIREFFRNDKRALLVTGARQTGKTYSIRKVAKECFEVVVEINFVENPEAIAMFSNVNNSQELLLRISAFAKQHLIPHKTIIFFDEVQECKEIVTAIKFLVDEGSYHYVLSGSLLGVELHDIRSIPVGYLSVLEMHPLDLEEFAIAQGVSPIVLSHLKECYDQQKAVDHLVHNKMLDLLRLYLIIGGMPHVVETYLTTNNLKRVLEIQKDIIRLYKQDIAKYDKQRKLNIADIYNLIPSELNAKNKRFILKQLNEKGRFSKYENSFVWLQDAGVAIPVYNIDEPTVPLLLSKQRNLFKLFLSDVGLLAAMYAGNIQQKLLSGELEINFGAIYENFAAQELYAHGLAGDEHQLFYFNSKQQGELDFVIENDGAILPIEIKSGKAYHRHNALNNVLSNQQYAIPKAIVFSNENVEEQDKVIYFPIYMIMFLQKQELSDDAIYKFDISGLN